jgi:hypothetical protein
MALFKFVSGLNVHLEISHELTGLSLQMKHAPLRNLCFAVLRRLKLNGRRAATSVCRNRF